MSWIAPVVQAVGDAGSMIGNNFFNREVNEANREWAVNMSEEEFRRNVEMWERTNTYNSPVEQRKRLELAGLNPALMYGNSASPGIASQSPKLELPKEGNFGKNMGFGNPMQGLLNAYNDLRRTNADVEKTQADARKKGLEGDILWFIKNLYEPDTGSFNESSPMYRRLMAQVRKDEESARSAEAKANWDTRRWEIYDKQGIDIDQLTNAGKYLEEKYGSAVSVFFDAIFGKVKSR